MLFVTYTFYVWVFLAGHISKIRIFHFPLSPDSIRENSCALLCFVFPLLRDHFLARAKCNRAEPEGPTACFIFIEMLKCFVLSVTIRLGLILFFVGCLATDYVVNPLQHKVVQYVVQAYLVGSWCVCTIQYFLYVCAYVAVWSGCLCCNNLIATRGEYLLL